MRIYYITFVLTIICILFGCEINEDHWDNFIDKPKSLGYEVLSVEASEKWIKKHSDEISLPNKIKFGKPHHLQDFGFAPYGIMIVVDTDNKYRVVARELPPDKTLLKVGDILFPFPPFNFSSKTFDGTTKESSPIDWETEIGTYVFEAKETIVQPDLEEVGETEVRVEASVYEVLELYDFKCTTYMSPNGATISYKLPDQTDQRDLFGFIVTKIDGTVFKRRHNLSPWRETVQEDVPRDDIDVSIIDHEWNDFIARKKLLGCEVLSAAASKTWIEKHSDEISIPKRILFGKPHYVQNRFFAPYGIMIALDSDDNYRVIARKLPPDKTLLKIGDTLTMKFIKYTDPDEFSDAFGDILNDMLDSDNKVKARKAFDSYINLVENKTRNFVFEPEETVLHHGIPMPKFKPKFNKKVEEFDIENYMGFDTYTLYMSPNGATISYNGWGVVTKIEGDVFQRVFDLTEIATSFLNKVVPTIEIKSHIKDNHFEDK